MGSPIQSLKTLLLPPSLSLSLSRHLVSAIHVRFTVLLGPVQAPKMSSLAPRLVNLLRVSTPISSSSHLATSVQRSSNSWFSTETFDVGDRDENKTEVEEDFDDLLGKPETQAHGVDPKRGWAFRGVHKAIICGRVGQSPVQKILRNGRTVTIFTVGTGGMFDQRIVGANNLPKPAQWHRIAVHNEALGAYAVRQLSKNSSVYVEGDIETRVYNDTINGDVKSVPEICVRHQGKIRLIKSGESISSISFDSLREGLL
ncbi:single-stranded DNA-binding protein, mitochondrial [Carica papaya]|uniref:single-stranded DNA-binding protein, mitochondrial n=1 Tax=Carica papaya TaxID=3649 RepID=UPI000B8CD6B5|nr:single-stranded DNA-binding protein, mitochondrial [Carica papaya]